MLFSIIIATCGRPDRLAVNLEAVSRAIQISGRPHRVIVVDNAPTHDARETFAACAAKASFPFRYLESAPCDKSAALNAGIAAAETEWLAFTDDDTLPDEDWLRAGTSFAEKSAFRVFGGRICHGAVDRGRLPRWLRPGRSGRIPGIGVFVDFDPPQSTGSLSDQYAAPFGANVFVHRDVFRQYGGYDEALWALCRGWPTGCEDSEFGWRLRSAGEPIGYCRDAVVIHPVNYDRASFWLHCHHAYYDGWRQPLIFMDPGRPWFEPYRLRLMGQRLAGLLTDAIRGDLAGVADHTVELARVIGAIIGRFSSAYRVRAKGHKAVL
jgi:GT2 family glycosyltransferase